MSGRLGADSVRSASRPGWQVGDAVVLGLYVAPVAGARMRAVESVLAVAGRGLEGDRYFHDGGTFARGSSRSCEVTLIDKEDLLAVERQLGIPIRAHDTRRNILVQGIHLGKCAGEEIRIGGAIVRGVRLCEPCLRLARSTGAQNMKVMVHRSGLQAEIVQSGVIQVGDAIASPSLDS